MAQRTRGGGMVPLGSGAVGEPGARVENNLHSRGGGRERKGTGACVEEGGGGG